MNIKIKTPVIEQSPLCRSYVVEITTLRNNESKETTFPVGPFKKGEDEASLESLLATLQRMKKRTRDAGGYHNYTGALGFMQWFANNLTIDDIHNYEPLALSFYPEETQQAIIELVGDKGTLWPQDVTEPDHTYSYHKNMRSHERLKSYNVFYYNKKNVKLNVKVTL